MNSGSLNIIFIHGGGGGGGGGDGGAGIQFHEGVPTTFHLQKWFSKGGLLVLDDLMVEGGEYKELLDLFTKHSHHQNITVLYLCQDMRDEECTSSSFSHLLGRHDGRVSKRDRTTIRVHGPRFTSCQ